MRPTRRLLPNLVRLTAAGHARGGQAENRMVLHALGTGIRAPAGHEHHAGLDQLQPAEQLPDLRERPELRPA
jgi:hypothetical protein